MAAVEVPLTLEYRGGQLNAAFVLEVENFTNWKKRFLCHIIGIEPQFENIIKNDPFIPMTTGQRKPKNQWTRDDRKAANLDQRLKSIIMSVLPDDQMNSVINYLTAKSTWDDLILYHEGLFDVKDLKLCYNTFKFKERESLTQTFTRYKALMNELVNDGIKLSKIEINTGFINRLPKKWLSFCQSFRNTNHVKDSELASLFSKLKYEENLINNSPDDEEDTRSIQEYLNDLEEEYQAKALLAKSKRFFKKASKALMVKKKGLIAEAYEYDEEEVSSDENEMVEVKVLMALAEENNVVDKESARNGEWVKISMRKCDIRKPIWYLDSGCSRHMTGVKSYLHKYVEQPGPKVVFGDDSTCTTEGYDSIKCNGIVFIKFDEKRGTNFNSNKEIVMIAPRVRDVYVLDMTSSAQESCFFAKASENLNCFGIKDYSYKLQNNQQTGKTESCPLTMKNKPLSLLMSTQGTPRNSILVNFCHEKGISQNFSSPYIPEQNGVAERKNRTLIQAARTMLS
ncbi:retrovirus-related pol polyprotein from transposon TNT 1-94 [Tanacetum coccineum]